MSNAEQIEYWNGDAGKRWAEEDDTMARLLHPVCEALLDHAQVAHCRAALDVGCGGGSQSVMLARRLGAGANVLGVDISQPMLDVALGKINQAGQDCAALDFLLADAASHPFEAASFDLIFSRFGVMFFDDPEAAFGNLRSALAPRGRLAFSCWQPLKDNDWCWIPIQAALQHVAPGERADPHAPGPFAFADPERVNAILGAAGFSNIELHSFTPNLQFSEAPSLAESVGNLARIGPVARLLEGQEPAVMAKVLTTMEQALEPYFEAGALKLPGAIWFVTAQVSGQ